MQDQIIVICNCLKEMLLDDEYLTKNLNYHTRRFYCANCGNDVYVKVNDKLGLPI